MTTRDQRMGALVVSVALMFAVAVPVIAADPPGKANAPGQNKPDKGPAIEITLNGTVVQSTDAKGRPTFEMTVGGTSWELSVGPKWWYAGATNPLAAHVGNSVEVTGTHREGSTSVSVSTINGQAVRAAGRPPWAGGPKAVGERHPAFKAWQAHARGGNGRGLGRANAPGQLKDKTANQGGSGSD